MRNAGAALVASSVAELTGVPGVAIVGAGPGVASVVNGVAFAALDRVPLVVVSDRYSAAEAATNGHQLLDHERLLAPLVKSYATVEPADAAETVAAAVAAALAPPRGPVHLELRRDTAESAAGAGAGAASRTPARACDLAGLRDRLRGARRPVLLLGLEARDAEQPALVAVAERLGAPVLVTYKAKGSFPESHPLFVGLLTGGRIEAPLLERADALVAIGLDPVELLPVPWPYRAPYLSLRSYADPADSYFAPAWTGAGELASAAAAGLATASAWTADEVAAARAASVDPLRIPGEGTLAAWEVWRRFSPRRRRTRR